MIEIQLQQYTCLDKIADLVKLTWKTSETYSFLTKNVKFKETYKTQILDFFRF